MSTGINEEDVVEEAGHTKTLGSKEEVKEKDKGSYILCKGMSPVT